MRFRHIFMGIGSVLVIALLFMSDPSVGFLAKLPIGSGTLGLLLGLVVSILYIALLHVSRKGLFDYLDLEKFFLKAYETPQGAGLALIAVAVAMVSIAIAIHAAAK